MPRAKHTARQDGRVKASVYIGVDSNGKKKSNTSMPTPTENSKKRLMKLKSASGKVLMSLQRGIRLDFGLKNGLNSRLPTFLKTGTKP